MQVSHAPVKTLVNIKSEASTKFAQLMCTQLLFGNKNQTNSKLERQLKRWINKFVMLMALTLCHFKTLRTIGMWLFHIL